MKVSLICTKMNLYIAHFNTNGFEQNWLKLGSHIPPTYLRHSRKLQLTDWQRSAICPSGPPAHLRWIADVLKFAWNANWIMQFSTILLLNMDWIVLLEYIVTADDVHIKYFHRRQPLACLRSWIPLNFAGKLAVDPWDSRDGSRVAEKCSHTPQHCSMSQVCRWHTEVTTEVTTKS